MRCYDVNIIYATDSLNNNFKKTIFLFYSVKTNCTFPTSINNTYLTHKALEISNNKHNKRSQKSCALPKSKDRREI